MQLLADHLPISLLWDLADPAGPDSADLLAHEGLDSVDLLAHQD